MIRKAHLADLPSVLDIWLQTNLEVHSFISPHYWQNNVDYMKQVLPQAEVFVYEDKNKIMGFVGLEKDYIAGIFVSKEFRSQGIGKQILDFIKSTHPTLSLSVYAKNQKAIRFYQRESFRIIDEGMDKENQEAEFLMQWK